MNTIERINTIKKDFSGEIIKSLGCIHEVTCSEMGHCLWLNIRGGIPLGFRLVQLLFIHPDAQPDGWVSPGEIALNAYDNGVSLVKEIPLDPKAIGVIKEIYSLYTGQDYPGEFNPEGKSCDLHMHSYDPYLTDLKEFLNKKQL